MVETAKPESDLFAGLTIARRLRSSRLGDEAKAPGSTASGALAGA